MVLYGVVSLLVVSVIRQVVFGYPDPFRTPTVVFVGVPVIAGLLQWPSRIVPDSVFGGDDEDAEEEEVEPEGVEHGAVEQQDSADDEGGEFTRGGDDERDEFAGDPARQRDEPIGDAAHGEYGVTGTVTHGDRSLQGVRVRALDKDLTTEERLGEATTTEGGQYRITYTDDDFARGERESVDLVVRVDNEVGTQIAESDVQFNIGQQTTVDIRIPGDETVTPSEYERLRSELEPLLEGRRLVTLDESERTFLVKELELADRAAYPAGEASLHLLVNAARLANQTPLREPVAYAIARQTERPWDSVAIAEANPEQLAGHVRAAVSAGVLASEPADLERRLGRAGEAISSSSRLPTADDRVPQIAIPRVVDATTGAPLSGYTVEVTGARDTDVQLQTASSVTDSAGGFGFSYFVPRETTDDGTDSEGAGDIARTFDVRVSKHGREVGTPELTLEDGTTGTIEIDAATPGSGSATTIGSLAETTNLELSDSTVASVRDLTLDDIRAAGGVEDTDLQVADADAARLESLAELTMVAPPQTATELYETGYDSHLAIARTPLETFRRDLSDALSPAEIERLRARAVAGADLLDELLLERRIALADERENGGGANTDRGDWQVADDGTSSPEEGS